MNLNLINKNYTIHPPSKYKSSLIFKEEYILYAIFFSMGFNKAILYIPIIGLFYFLKLSTLNKIHVKKYFAILLGLYSSFLFSTIFIGYERLTIDNPLIILFIIMIPLFFAGIPFQYQKYNVKINLLGVFLFGIFLDSFAIVVYSFMTDPILYGYGKVISPFTENEGNSPAVSNMLALSFSYFYFLVLFPKKAIYIKFLSLCIILLSFISAIFLGGRTFFILAILTIVIHLFSNLSVKKIILFFLIAAISSIGLFYAFSTNEYLSYYFDLTFNRFDNGLKSNRFAHYSHGLEMLWQYPFGGFEVNTSIEDTSWYHNIFFDTARVAGWIPITFFIISILYTSKFLFYKNKIKSFILPLSVGIVTFFVMQQDVVLEGGHRSIIVLFFVSLLLLNSKENLNENK